MPLIYFLLLLVYFFPFVDSNFLISFSILNVLLFFLSLMSIPKQDNFEILGFRYCLKIFFSFVFISCNLKNVKWISVVRFLNPRDLWKSVASFGKTTNIYWNGICFSIPYIIFISQSHLIYIYIIKINEW